MSNKENGRVDAMEMIAEKTREIQTIAREHKIKIVLICIFEDDEKKGICHVKGGISRQKAFHELASAIAEEFAETIQEEI